MSQVAAGPSDHSQEKNGNENAVVQARTQTFQLGTQNHKIRMVGTIEDPWFVAADIGKVLGIEKMAQHLKNYKDDTEKGVEESLYPRWLTKADHLIGEGCVQISHEIAETRGRAFSRLGCGCTSDYTCKRSLRIRKPASVLTKQTARRQRRVPEEGRGRGKGSSRSEGRLGEGK